MMFTPKALRPSPGRTKRAKPSHSEGSSWIALPLAVSSDTVRASGCVGAAGTHARGAGLLACAGVAVQRAALHGLVDRPHERAVLGLGGRVVATGDRGLEAAEVRLDRRRVAAVLEALAL